MNWQLVLKRTWRHYNRYNIPRLGAALAYYTLFALFPLVLLLINLLGYVVATNPSAGWDAREFVIGALQQFFPTIRGSIYESIYSMIENRGTVNVVGLVALLWSASHVFDQLVDIFDLIFGYNSESESIVNTVRGRLFAMFLVVLLAGLLFVSIFLNAFLTSLGGFVEILPGGGFAWRAANLSLGLFVPALVITAMFRWLPWCTVSWRTAAIGGAVTAVGWKGGSILLGWYIAQNRYDALYGTVGSVLGLMVWVYYISQVLLLGAALTVSLDETWEKAPADTALPPATVHPKRRGREGGIFLGGAAAGVLFLVGLLVTTVRQLLRLRR